MSMVKVFICSWGYLPYVDIKFYMVYSNTLVLTMDVKIYLSLDGFRSFSTVIIGSYLKSY